MTTWYMVCHMLYWWLRSLSLSNSGPVLLHSASALIPSTDHPKHLLTSLSLSGKPFHRFRNRPRYWFTGAVTTILVLMCVVMDSALGQTQGQMEGQDQGQLTPMTVQSPSTASSTPLSEGTLSPMNSSMGAPTTDPNLATPDSHPDGPSSQPVQQSPPGVVPPPSPIVPVDRSGHNQNIQSPLHPMYGSVRFEPYNTGDREINLWGLENEKFFRSPPVVAPDLNAMAYTEVAFMPHSRQTFSKLYLVPLSDISSYTAEAVVVPPTPMVDPLVETPQQAQDIDYEMMARSTFNPDHNLKNRTLLLGVGHDTHQRFAFETLTIVDWSASGQKLLVKKQTGVLHIGLRTSDLIVFDRHQGTVSIYPEIQRMVAYFWDRQGVIPPLNTLAWDIEPLGWSPQSDTTIVFRAWAYDKRTKKYLGLWEYNITAERGQLLSTTALTTPFAQNGTVPTVEQAHTR